MADDFTQDQSDSELQEALQLSLQATSPPSQIPGYRLERFLGAGAFGQVWVGRAINTGRPVAVKFYLHRGGMNWRLLSREVKQLVQLSADRRVVQILEVGWDGDPPYYVMEYVPSGSLEDLLTQRRRLSVRRAVELFRRICVGLNHCHAKGVLHCDLKPANILLDQDLDPRLADFGQSRMSNEQTPALGTLFYMAPEQADLEAVPDASWDVYALGAILYRMLTGSAPHRDQSLIHDMDTAGTLPQRLTRYRHAIETNPAPRGHYQRRGVDRALGAILDRCLAPHPEHRFANVQQVIEALDRRDSARARRPFMLLGIVGPLLLLLATSIYATRSISQSRKRFTDGLRAASYNSNQFAARFAASTLQNQIQNHFDVAVNEASDTGLLAKLQQVWDDPELASLLQSLADPTADLDEPRQQFLHDPVRLQIDQYLELRIEHYRQLRLRNELSPTLSTMFIADAQGTIIGMGYDAEISLEGQSTGRNFAYRSYFHGGHEDLPINTPSNSIRPLQQPHLSPAFKSTSTNMWKVAISTPIFNPDDREQTLGVLVITVNLGDFRLIQSVGNQEQVAVLIDARAGERFGTILQHPWMDRKMETSGPASAQRFQLPADVLEDLLVERDVDYRDPIAEAGDTGDYGQSYAGEWLAAVQPVPLPLRDQAGEDVRSNLIVLVQYRLSEVISPVQVLIRSLFIEGAILVTAIVLVTFLMWFFVMRATDFRPEAIDDQEERKPEVGNTLTIESSS